LDHFRRFREDPSLENAQRLFDPFGSPSPSSSSEHNDMGFNRTKDAYEIAKAGGKNAGLLRNYAGRSTEEIQKAQRNYEKQVEIHKEKLANPEKYAERWGNMTMKERQDLMNTWRDHMKQNQDRANIMRGIRHERGVE